MIEAQRHGILYLVSGPSGSGKTTLCRKLASDGHAQYAVSATTRAPREGEVDGQSYHFLSKDRFEALVREGAFLEYARVHDHFYGTLKSEVLGVLEQGLDVVMDIDVQGAASIRALGDTMLERCLLDLFVMPPSQSELAARLRGRATDSPEVISLRLQNAMEEMDRWHEYTYRLVSGTREEDYAAFRGLLLSERLRVNRLKTSSL